MKQLIENLLRRPEPPKRFCEVVKPLQNGRYQVRDSQGRLFPVDADISWQIGAGVTVSQGRIVGPGARFKQPKVYEV